MILVLNAGSSSLKAALFAPDLTAQFTAKLAEIAGDSRLTIDGTTIPARAPDHQTALALILQALATAGHPVTTLTAVAHRVVHGGADLVAPVVLTPAATALIQAAIPLAPLHNPANLACIHAMAALAPGLPQTASFDTAFHATNPDVATTYALPAAERAKGIRRFGFHGLSYASLTHSLSHSLTHSLTPSLSHSLTGSLTGSPPHLPRRLLALHLGNGASLCAILDGRSVATSMGYSPLDGLVMGTRPGSIDPMAVLRLAQDHGIDGAGQMLNHASGLRALAGTNDMRALLSRSDAEARFAVDHFCYWAIRHAGSAIAAMGGLDAIAFTGGIGENAGAVRDRISAGLRWAGDVPVHVVRADEERQIARDALSLLQRKVP